MKKGILTMGIIKKLRLVRGICPVCGHELKWNPMTGKRGQWAHFLCNTKPHLKRYGEEIINSQYNGILVCELNCNNAVQLNYKSRPVLCDELAEEIRETMKMDKAVMARIYGPTRGKRSLNQMGGNNGG